ncbi:hypothetical protein NVV94_02730 [Pseudomonas sp. LS1212]|nr:hypothetical protein [Pseudomonas sp. LS1212]UVJ44540.1 hypothetical protein NVV94_02730 [Pseudomonas sp. LS1212]
MSGRLADNCPPELRSLARSVMHQLEVAKALVEASIAGLDDVGSPATQSG